MSEIKKKRDNSRIDLLNGSIAKALFWLALPIMGSSFVQMAYNLFDTMWVGQLGNSAVTAVGTAGSFMWIGQGIAMIPQIGGQIQCGQSIGENDIRKAGRYARESVQLMLVSMIIYAALSIIFRESLISFFRLHDAATAVSSQTYLMIVSLGYPFMGFNFVMQGLMTAAGDSRTSFKFNATGMLLNIILDPLMIFGIGFFPVWGVNGAAAATIISEAVVSLLFFNFIRHDSYLFSSFSFIEKPERKELIHIMRLGAPPALFNIAFAIVNMIISRIIVTYGDSAIAIQKIGGQIESVSWMSSDGFAVAMNAFTAQNFGADRRERVKQGFRTGMLMMTVYGILITALLIIGAAPIFDIFINDPATIAGGADYLRILGFSQLFICYEIVTTGAFNGLGKTRFPAATGFILTAARIPACFILAPLMGGINGIWWAISLSSILKGTVLLAAYLREMSHYTAQSE